MAIKRTYDFGMKPVRVVTPLATTLFMCLRDTNEYTGKFGGKLILSEQDLGTVVNVFKDGSDLNLPFGELVELLLDEAYTEYTTETKKKAEKVELFKQHTDADGEDIEGVIEFTIKSNERPVVVDASRVQVTPNNIPLLGNGSKVKAQINLKPYVMNGKVGLTAYANAIQIIEVNEYSKSREVFALEDGFTTVAVEEADEIQF